MKGLLIGVAAAAVAACVGFASPAPPRRQRSLEVRPGRYVMRWGEGRFTVNLKAGGGCVYECGCVQKSQWKWYPRERVFLIQDACAWAGGGWWSWEGVLGPDLSGELRGGGGGAGVKVKLERAGPD
jgi:hypothetical protein